MRLLAVALLALAVAATVALAPHQFMGPADSVAGTASLAASLEPLREDFNRHADRPRILALLSPSCPRCYDGARALETLLAERPGTPLRMTVVWQRRLAWDLPQKVRKRGRELFAGDPRAAFFWDPGGRAAGAVAEALDWRLDIGPWDVYMVFAPGARWEGALPHPAAWYHQLRGTRPDRYRSAGELLGGLEGALDRALEGAPAS